MLTTDETKQAVKADVNADVGFVHLIIFKLGEEEFGIPIEQVKEVTITPPISRMPKSPPFIKGVANIRGDIIAIMDMEERFNISKNEDEELPKQTYTLVTEFKDYFLGLVVREMPQSIYVPTSNLEKTPEMIHSLLLNEKYVDRIAKIDERLIIILDIKKILSQDEARLLKQ